MEDATFLPGPPVPPGAVRELRAAQEIAHAFLTSESPIEVYRLALERVCRLVNAGFGCVFLREGADSDGDLLRVVAAHSWPQRYAAYLSDMRVRVGSGPTGCAVERNEPVEVYDVLSDEGHRDWWDIARELGFSSSVSLPITLLQGPIGAITLYFGERHPLCEADRSLLRLVADQLSATVEKAHLIHDLRRANATLKEQNEELEIRYREAEEARRLKSEFLANVSHELRTPLTAILGYAYLLREGLSGELTSDQGGAVEKIEEAGTTLMRLINDLLDLTNIRLARTPLEPEICDAVLLCRAALTTTAAPVEGIDLRAELPGEPLPLYTDPGQVVRILQNLLSNAIKFTEEGSVVLRVRGESSPGGGRAVVWEIEDTGIGINPDSQEAIFDEFRQVDGSATRRYGGTGLGLALSRGLARQLGGEVAVRSSPDSGSVFTLTLPAEGRKRPAG